MGGDFNCHDERWDPLIRWNINGDKLLAAAEGLGLRISLPPARIPTRLPWGDPDALGSVIDLVFVSADSPADLVHAVLDLERDSSDHAPLQVTIPTLDDIPDVVRRTIPSQSEEAARFSLAVTEALVNVGRSQLNNPLDIEEALEAFSMTVKGAFDANAKTIQIAARSNRWWNADCKTAIQAYRDYRTEDNLQEFKRTVKKAKMEFFKRQVDNQVAKNRVWDLLN